MAHHVSAPVTTGQASIANTLRCSLPMELWIQIFKEASAIPGKDELSLDQRGYSEIPYDPRVRSARLASRELQVALYARAVFVLVCKSWYDMGLPVLYSHYRVCLHNDTAEKHPLWLNSARGSQLASYVLRLTVVDTRWNVPIDDREQVAEQTGRIGSLIPKLSRLLILVVSPTLYWSIPPSFNSTIVIAHFTTRERCIKMDIRHVGHMKALQSLDLRLDRTSTGACHLHPVSLPFLVSLAVSVGEMLGFPVYEEEVDYSIVNIFNQWDTPTLHSLSLYSEDWSYWKPFIERNASRLRVLHIRFYPQNMNGFPTLDLPHLRELYVEPGPRSYYPGCKIHCPALRRVALHRWRSRRYLTDSWTPKSQELTFFGRVLECWMTEAPGVSYRISGDDQVLSQILGNNNIVNSLGALQGRGSYVCVADEDRPVSFFGKATIEGTRVVPFHDHLGCEYRRVFIPPNSNL